MPPITTEILTKLFYTSGPNLVILAWMGCELWCGQFQNGVNFDFQVKFDLEDQGRSVHKTIGTLTRSFAFWPKFSYPSLNGSRVIARTSKWLTHRQTDRQTDRQTERQTQIHTHRRRQRQYPKAQNWPRVKKYMYSRFHLQIQGIHFLHTYVAALVLVGAPKKSHCNRQIPLPLDKMAAVSQTIFSDACSWIKSFVIWLKHHWSLFLSVWLTITHDWFR